MIRDYELTYIIKPDVDPATLTTLVERVNGFVTSEGGTVVKTNQWGLRHLAYPIRRYREGHYVFSVIQIEAPALARIEQRLRLIEDMLRFLLVRADEDAAAGAAEGNNAGAGASEAEDVMGESVDAAAPIAPVAGVVEEPAAAQASA
jgi:small subunit ribosomal protein S6